MRGALDTPPQSLNGSDNENREAIPRRNRVARRKSRHWQSESANQGASPCCCKGAMGQGACSAPERRTERRAESPFAPVICYSTQPTMNYYNEHDPKAAAWLRELIRAGEIPPGDVDERDIQYVKQHELAQYIQCHFFAGIGGWSLALKLAGWPQNKSVWTASCPCQPFSVGGDGKGTADERHLWPVFAELARARKPPTIYGEQVASALGREWLAGVFADLEGMGYQRAAADLCAAGVGAPHIRQRLYWVAHTECQRLQRRGGTECQEKRARGQANSRGFYSETSIVQGANGKIRRIEPALIPVANGIPGRVASLRGYGNAINPILAAEFIGAHMECCNHY